MATRAVARRAPRRRTTVVRRVGRRAKKTTIPITVAAPILSEFFSGPYPRIKAGNWSAAMNSIMMDYTGYDAYGKHFDINHLKAGALPLGVGLLMHKVFNKFGVNRMIANAGIPWIRI